MDENHLQFGGNPPASSEQRVGVYVVIYNDQGNILVCEVDNELHLLGGRVEEGEDHIEAMNREAMEEAGARIDNIELIGKANQYFPEDNLNKIGTLYKSRIVSFNPELSQEKDHHPKWMTPEEFIKGNSGEFQKWAVSQTEDFNK